MEHRVVIVEATQVKSCLRREGMMSEMGLSMLDSLRSLGLQCAVCTGQLLVKYLFSLHAATLALARIWGKAVVTLLY